MSEQKEMGRTNNMKQRHREADTTEAATEIQGEQSVFCVTLFKICRVTFPYKQDND